MMKQLIDAGVWQYDDLEEAKQDAQSAADDSHKVTKRYRQIMYVLKDQHYYYGPVNDSRRQSLGYRDLLLAHTAYPSEGKR